MDNLYVSQDGSRFWMDDNDRAHRDGGPAREYIEGICVWYQHGRRHREDGPAIIFADDAGCQWCLNDIMYSFEEWLIENTAISEEEKVMLKLKYG